MLKIVKSCGGLGNQMFQYAFYVKLKHLFNDVKFDTSYFDIYKDHNGYELDKIFDLKIDYCTSSELDFFINKNKSLATRLFRKISNHKRHFYYETQGIFDPDLFNYSGNKYYDGLWQSDLYFQGYENEIRKDFKLSPDLNNDNKHVSDSILKTNSVSIHIRRGDYLNYNAQIDDLNYYKQGIELIENKIGNLTLFIFSDDINWVKNNFNVKYNQYFIDHNKGPHSYIDLYLMSICKHNIIANSTFSWWAAWLNNNPEKIVIAPKKWFYETEEQANNIIPKNWIKI